MDKRQTYRQTKRKMKYRYKRRKNKKKKGKKLKKGKGLIIMNFQKIKKKFFGFSQCFEVI